MILFAISPESNDVEREVIQSALHLPDEEKTRQEKAPLREVPDSFSKIVLVRDVVKPTYDNEGILTMS
ncbi:hypothetical protein, partial [Ellagibacter isourolithinifaciens]|uniref:hypothetical protein n=1 Tax=Ellagibacter isourolithinifaciens TaxID=2137581 RepID=UPI003AAF53FC